MSYESFLNQEITIQEAELDSNGVVKRGDYGEKKYLSGSTHSARIEYDTRAMTDEDGKEVISNGRCFVDSSVSVKPQDKLILPDGSNPPIIRVFSQPDGSGNIHHKIIYFG